MLSLIDGIDKRNAFETYCLSFVLLGVAPENSVSRLKQFCFDNPNIGLVDDQEKNEEKQKRILMANHHKCVDPRGPALPSLKGISRGEK